MKPWTIALVAALLLPFGQANAAVVQSGYFAALDGGAYSSGQYDVADFRKSNKKKVKNEQKKSKKHHKKRRKGNKDCHSPS